MWESPPLTCLTNFDTAMPSHNFALECAPSHAIAAARAWGTLFPSERRLKDRSLLASADVCCVWVLSLSLTYP